MPIESSGSTRQSSVGVFAVSVLGVTAGGLAVSELLPGLLPVLLPQDRKIPADKNSIKREKGNGMVVRFELRYYGEVYRERKFQTGLFIVSKIAHSFLFH